MREDHPRRFARGPRRWSRSAAATRVARAGASSRTARSSSARPSSFADFSLTGRVALTALGGYSYVEPAGSRRRQHRREHGATAGQPDQLAERWVKAEDIGEELAVPVPPVSGRVRACVARRRRAVVGRSRATSTLRSDACAACGASRGRGRRLGLLDLPRAPIPPADIPAPVRFLRPGTASSSSTFVGQACSPKEYRSRIFPTTMPQSIGTFLVDGAVAGTWRHDAGRVAGRSIRESIARRRGKSRPRPSALRAQRQVEQLPSLP